VSKLQTTGQPDRPALTAAQKRFNTLIRQIEQARRSLADWTDGIRSYRASHAALLAPLQQELRDAHRLWILRLDELLGQPGWSRTERRTLRRLVCGAAGDVLEAGVDDAQVRAIYERHGKVDYEAEQREMAIAMKELAQHLTGLDLGDDEGIDSQEDLLRRLREGLEREAAEEQEPASAPRRRTSAREQRHQAQARQATQSVREVYRKLASALHPDRERDPVQREAKNALMQRANQAYEAGDLLTLLQLQLQLEQVQTADPTTIDAVRLRHYNRVLEEQLKELKQEIGAVELGWQMEFGIDSYARCDPRKLGSLLRDVERQWRSELAGLQRDLKRLDDRPATRAWLQREHRRMQQEDREMPF
jgi:hypothetical protein